MPAPSARSRPRSSADAAERLYVLWLVSTLLLVVLIVIVTMLGSGHLRRQALVIDQQTRLIEQLSQRIAEAERAANDARRAVRTVPATVPLTRPDGGVSQPAPVPSIPASRPTPTSSDSIGAESDGSVPASSPSSRAARTDDDVHRTLDELLRPGELAPLEITDRDEAERFLEEVRGAGEQVRWTGQTLARLAALARLLGHDGPAEWFAVRAASAGQFPADYHEIAVRQLLDAGRAAEASIAARRLLESGAARPSDIGLLAAALAKRGEPAGADEALTRLSDDDIRGLHPRDRLRVAQALAAVEKWERLEFALATVSDAADAARPAIDALRAILSIQRGRFPEALGILDNLLEETPDDYDLRTWRAVALLEAHQTDAARAAFAHAERSPARPEAWHWRGVLELRDGKLDAARAFLERAITASQRYAPAWEALAALEMILADQAASRDDDATARAQLEAARVGAARAIAVNPRRSGAHFLLAVVHAKAGRSAESAASLQAAFMLDRAWIDTAKKTPVLNRLLSPEEIDELAGPPTSQPSA